MKVDSPFLMHQYAVGAGCRERLQEQVGMLDHQVCFKRKARHGPQCLNDDRTHADIRNEMPIHDVDVDAVRSRTLRLGDLLSQASEIGRKNRRGKLDSVSCHDGVAFRSGS